MGLKFELCNSIKTQLEINFDNLEIAMKAIDRDALICGAKAWRYVYHTLHSCDKWLINNAHFTEPPFHKDGLDNPDTVTAIELSDKQLWEYFFAVKKKSLDYISRLDDEMLYDKPSDCKFTRIELILGQFRHLMTHVGILNGITIAQTGKFPIIYGLEPRTSGDKIFYD